MTPGGIQSLQSIAQCRIDSWVEVQGHTEYVIQLAFSDRDRVSSTCQHRYSDFCGLHALIKSALALPALGAPKHWWHTDAVKEKRSRGLEHFLTAALQAAAKAVDDEAEVESAAQSLAAFLHTDTAEVERLGECLTRSQAEISRLQAANAQHVEEAARVGAELQRKQDEVTALLAGMQRAEEAHAAALEQQRAEFEREKEALQLQNDLVLQQLRSSEQLAQEWIALARNEPAVGPESTTATEADADATPPEGEDGNTTTADAGLQALAEDDKENAATADADPPAEGDKNKKAKKPRERKANRTAASRRAS